MPNYNVAGIKLTFNYNFDTFFKDNIEKYIMPPNEPVDYLLEVIVSDTIPPPLHPPTITHKNRFVTSDETQTTLWVTNTAGSVTTRIDNTHDYKHVTIYLNTSLKEKLPEQEYVLSGLLFLEIALKENRLAMHASAIDFQGAALLFAASSGTGKSTHTLHWSHIFKDNVKIINDDKPLIYHENNQFFVAGTPWSGKTRQNENIVSPLKAIFFIERGKANALTSLSLEEALKDLLKNALRPRDESLMNASLPIIENILLHVPLYRFYATKTRDSARYLYQELYKEKTHEN